MTMKEIDYRAIEKMPIHIVFQPCYIMTKLDENR